MPMVRDNAGSDDLDDYSKQEKEAVVEAWNRRVGEGEKE
jgi:hypothetical protein